MSKLCVTGLRVTKLCVTKLRVKMLRVKGMCVCGGKGFALKGQSVEEVCVKRCRLWKKCVCVCQTLSTKGKERCGMFSFVFLT